MSLKGRQLILTSDSQIEIYVKVFCKKLTPTDVNANLLACRKLYKTILRGETHKALMSLQCKIIHVNNK